MPFMASPEQHGAHPLTFRGCIEAAHLQSSSACPERHGMACRVRAAVDAFPPHMHVCTSRPHRDPR